MIAVEQLSFRRVEQRCERGCQVGCLTRRVKAATQLVAVEEVQKIRGAFPELGDVVLAQLLGDVLDEQVLVQVGRRR